MDLRRMLDAASNTETQQMNIEADIRNLGKWLNEEQTAPINRQALARLLAWAQMADKPAAWVYPEFFEGIAKAGCWTAYAGDGFGQHPDGVERFPLYRGPWPARPQEPTVEDNSQDWRGMDGTTAYWLIQRHADGWPDIGKMMGEWLDANRAQPAQPQKPLTGGDERRHIICLCPDCTKPAQQQEPVAWCPDVCPITGLPFFMWIEHHETGQKVPTYGGPYDSYTIPVRDKDGSYCRERYDHDLGGWLTDELEDVGIQIVSDQAYVSDDPPASKPLTDEQIENLIPDDDTPMSLGEAFVKFARLVEAAHGIKGDA